MSSILKNILFAILSTLAALGLMWWVYRGFDFGGLVSFFTHRTNYLWMSLAALFGVCANVLRSLRWRELLRGAGIQISVRRSVELIFISYLVNSLTPRLGELTRSLLVRRGDPEVTTKALGTVVVEKLVDVACLVVVAGIAVMLRWKATVGLVDKVGEGLQWVVPSYSFYIIVGGFVCLLIGISLPLWHHVRRFFRNLWLGISALSRLESPLTFVSLSAVIWTFNFLQMFVLVPCFPGLEDISTADFIHVFAAASIGMLLPTPAGAGPWHFAIVKTLTLSYAVEKAVAQSFAFISHGIKTLLVIFLGLIGCFGYNQSLISRVRQRK